jgi:hypothetical protein
MSVCRVCSFFLARFLSYDLDHQCSM